MEKYKIAVEKHVKTFVDTVAMLVMIATAVTVSLVLTGHEELVQNQTAQAVLWYLVIGQVLYVTYKIYRLQLNQK